MNNFIEILRKKLENEEFFLTIKKVAEIFSVSKATILNKIKKGEIKYVKVGRLYKIPKESLLEYVEKNFVKNS